MARVSRNAQGLQFQYSHASPRLSYGPFKLFSPRKGNYYYFQPQSLFKRLVWLPQWHRLLPPCDFDARHRSGAEPTLCRSKSAPCPFSHAPKTKTTETSADALWRKTSKTEASRVLPGSHKALPSAGKSARKPVTMRAVSTLT